MMIIMRFYGHHEVDDNLGKLWQLQRVELNDDEENEDDGGGDDDGDDCDDDNDNDNLGKLWQLQRVELRQHNQSSPDLVWASIQSALTQIDLGPTLIVSNSQDGNLEKLAFSTGRRHKMRKSATCYELSPSQMKVNSSGYSSVLKMTKLYWYRYILVIFSIYQCPVCGNEDTGHDKIDKLLATQVFPGISQYSPVPCMWETGQ